MLPFPLKRSHAISVEEQKDTGGQFKQDLQMKLQLISSGVQNAETPGEDQIKNISLKKRKYLGKHEFSLRFKLKKL